MNTITPPYPDSQYITSVSADPIRIHKGDGDMWPLTWAADDNIYAGAGDNMGSPMNFWKVTGHPGQHHSWSVSIYNIDNLPIDPADVLPAPARASHPRGQAGRAAQHRRDDLLRRRAAQLRRGP